MEVSDAETAHLGKQELVMWLVHAIQVVVATAVAAGCDSPADRSVAFLAVDASTAEEVLAVRCLVVYSGLTLASWTVSGSDSDAGVHGMGRCEVDAD